MGVTLRVPFRATVPMPLSMLADVAFVVAQVSVEELPEVMDCGLAEIVTVGSWLTVMVTLLVTVPAGPVAVIV